MGIHADGVYRFIWMTVLIMSSTVVMVLELAWNPLWVVIILTNSSEMSTLDISRELGEMVPRPFSPGRLVMASPLSRVSRKRLPPTLFRPWVLKNLARPTR